MRAPLGCLFMAFLSVVAVGCDDANRTLVGPMSPSPATTAPGPSPVAPQAVRVVSGGTGQPVVGAAVTVNGRAYSTDEAGIVGPDVVLSVPMAANSIDVEAPGFLKRETRVPEDGRITLWPVASEEEAQAVREMVYRRAGSSEQVLHPASVGEPFYVTLEGTISLGTYEAWQAGAMAFGAPFSLSYEVRGQFGYDQNEITVRFGETASCAPASAWGFCQEVSPYRIFRVLPERALDQRTIRRVVASWFLGPNPLPGFMNPTTPADDLSPFEIQTIRMILQRDRPNRWPDNDR